MRESEMPSVLSIRETPTHFAIDSTNWRDITTELTQLESAAAAMSLCHLAAEQGSFSYDGAEPIPYGAPENAVGEHIRPMSLRGIEPTADDPQAASVGPHELP